MKINMPINQTEYRVDPKQPIVTRTDLKGIICRIPSDHIPIRSWPLFLARELMRDLIETLKAEQST